MTDRELMQQALEALELLARYENPATKIQVRKPKDGGPIVTMYPHKVATDAAVPLRERLAQPEQEPLKFNCTVVDDAHPEGVPLSQWGRQPLTEAAIRGMCERVPDYDISTHDLIQFARTIEAAHGIKEKNT